MAVFYEFPLKLWIVYFDDSTTPQYAHKTLDVYASDIASALNIAEETLLEAIDDGSYVIRGCINSPDNLHRQHEMEQMDDAALEQYGSLTRVLNHAQDSTWRYE